VYSDFERYMLAIHVLCTDALFVFPQQICTRVHQDLKDVAVKKKRQQKKEVPPHVSAYVRTYAHMLLKRQ
jgi:hypothetical protein